MIFMLQLRQPGLLQRVSEDAEFMIFSSTFFQLFGFTHGTWPVQPGVNHLYASLEQVVADADAN